MRERAQLLRARVAHDFRRLERRGRRLAAHGTVFAVAVALATFAVGFSPADADSDVTGSWEALPPMPFPRSALAAAVDADGRIYAIGGRDGAGNGGARVDVFDPAERRWTRRRDMPTPRGGLAAVTGPDGRIYAIGGYRVPRFRGAVRTVEAFDPRTNRWIRRAPMRVARLGHAAVVGLDGKIYVIGGRNRERPLRNVEVYDVLANRWRRGVPMPTPRSSLAAARAAGGVIYAIGGTTRSAPATSHYAIAVVEAYSPATKTWRRMTPLHVPRWGHAAAADSRGRVYVIGGAVTAPDQVTRGVRVYNARKQSWTSVAPMLAERSQPAAVTAPDGTIYVVGGRFWEREPSGERFVAGR